MSKVKEYRELLKKFNAARAELDRRRVDYAKAVRKFYRIKEKLKEMK